MKVSCTHIRHLVPLLRGPCREAHLRDGLLLVGAGAGLALQLLNTQTRTFNHTHTLMTETRVPQRWLGSMACRSCKELQSCKLTSKDVPSR